MIFRLGDKEWISDIVDTTFGTESEGSQVHITSVISDSFFHQPYQSPGCVIFQPFERPCLRLYSREGKIGVGSKDRVEEQNWFIKPDLRLCRNKQLEEVHSSGGDLWIGFLSTSQFSSLSITLVSQIYHKNSLKA